MRASVAAIAASALLLAGCASEPDPAPTPDATTTPSLSASAEASEFPGPVVPTGEVSVIAEGLDAPWSIVRLAEDVLPGGSTLVSERDTAVVREITAEGEVRAAGTVPGVVPGGEGGLLGLATLRDGDTVWLYAYHTAASDNRIVRMPLQGAAGSLALGAPEPVLTGIPKAGNHNGGRIAFGPDGMLYATAGDAGRSSLAQDSTSLAGKILRMTPEGAEPPDSPYGTVVHSIGHRNPQGITWGDDGTMYASEFGQNTWDELNIIVAGQNYGWPEVEGIANVAGYVNPIQQWSPAEASPSGLTHTRDTLFMAALRGERLWSIVVGPESVDATAHFTGEFGRLRDVTAGPDGTLWAVTNNTDGRGSPRPGDDRLLQIQLQERTPG
ncbi:PQQ-dependent sugar dehydrogenase [Salinibacterium sp. SYSU T00001]|uniref:PQQ-dependent sugar dehydrogenase n=1 Tax=Homoserinimonas sedimenticola TaxID=2986805 RepID=UPI002235E7E8|nr:PQQ-dependent sugar dehydrogenase [Salinibacterium sedimenticola]MCW4385340.1 PQQ-dependent sugar dehydrogenase [Salinibacterium sedimenticola]